MNPIRTSCARSLAMAIPRARDGARNSDSVTTSAKRFFRTRWRRFPTTAHAAESDLNIAAWRWGPCETRMSSDSYFVSRISPRSETSENRKVFSDGWHSVSGELTYLTIAEAAALLRKKKLSPVELAQTALEQIETLNPRLNAFITFRAAGYRLHPSVLHHRLIDSTANSGVSC